MTKSELFEKLSSQRPYMLASTIENAGQEILEHMSTTLTDGYRIEIRGFGSFSLHYRAARLGRNPKSGDKILLAEKYVLHFKPAKKLRDRVNIYI